MGRPFWDRVHLGDVTNPALSSDVIELAASMLLGGASVLEPASFSEQSLHGVASVLCRVGVRPSTWSWLARRAVAQFACVLQHTNGRHNQFATTYSSDSVLTFGAALVWYHSTRPEDVHARLALDILPAFRKLLRQRVVDTGSRHGDLAGCLVLLLAMDATGVVATSSPLRRQYAGEFYSVETFLHVLHGDQSLVARDQQGNNVTVMHRGDVKAWRDRWRPWQIGFSHFVQLTEAPDEHTLWALLARRAAGIVPRDSVGVELLTPMFKENTVSLILVHVTTRDSDPCYRQSASTSMWPSVVFTNELQLKQPTEVVRLYMSLRGPDKTALYLLDPIAESDSWVLCVNGLDAWSATGVSVLSKAVGLELQKLLLPWWEPLSVVDEDLAGRGDYDIMTSEDVRAIASLPLVATLLQKP